MNIVDKIVLTLGFATIAVVPSMGMAQTVAASGNIDPGSIVEDGVDDAGGNGGTGSQNAERQIENVVNVLLFVLGAIAVVMIIIGGIRYATSNGDQTQVTAAKNTILYSVIGLVVAILAYAIVNFVVGAFTPDGGGGGGGSGSGRRDRED